MTQKGSCEENLILIEIFELKIFAFMSYAASMSQYIHAYICIYVL